jgi:hypothetical protein
MIVCPEFVVTELTSGKGTIGDFLLLTLPIPMEIDMNPVKQLFTIVELSKLYWNNICVRKHAIAV